ncbi:pyruvate:ferredoxin (flavodoxin) oxidoreductase [Pseudobutyrivibrio xylanivorans]|nr:pyruvate:ferredoxin (flavodoxin) oxidoreductase [Pseudobutyrivibrio xylanivorans]
MRETMTIDGNEAAALVAYQFTEAAFIYPITPSTSMAEKVEKWSSENKTNLLDEKVEVCQMQSEAGVAGAMHGALACGALASTFTSSQGLLLMLPNMYKIAAERLPGVFYVASRTVATHALSIFGDHSDIYAMRQTGAAILCASSVQEVMDLAPVAHASALAGRLPVIFFFDGFRTSHETQKIECWSKEALKDFFDSVALKDFRDNSLHPDHDVIMGSAQNPDVFFQTREASNLSYMLMPETVKAKMNIVNTKLGTSYAPFNYYGAKDAEHVVVAMGSVCETLCSVVDYMNRQGSKVGVCKVRLYRPFSGLDFIDCLPDTVRQISVLDRTKEPGGAGEPLYLDVLSALNNSRFAGVAVFHGRYGLASKDTTPEQLIAVFENRIKKEFTIGIKDDVTLLSLDSIEVNDNVDFSGSNICCKFWGRGGDGTISGCKNIARIIGDNTELYPQLYSEYDSRKTGGLTISHLRIGTKPIRAPYLVRQTHFAVCMHFEDLKNQPAIVSELAVGGKLLVNCDYSADELTTRLPLEICKALVDKKIFVYTIDADGLSKKIGLGPHINIMCIAAFMHLAQIMPADDFSMLLANQTSISYGDNNSVLNKNLKAIELGCSSIVKMDFNLNNKWNDNSFNNQDKAEPPVSAYLNSANGKSQRGCSALVKPGLAKYVPVWTPNQCIQCNHCSFVCPHAAIRPFALSKEECSDAPDGLKYAALNGLEKYNFSINVSVMDCTGCASCLSVCPNHGHALTLKPLAQAKENQMAFDYCASLPPKTDISKKFRVHSVKGSQFQKPLLEFSGACGGCGETPYAKLLTQLFGERMYIANATGCSSIWGNSAPYPAYASAYSGKGPAWSNSLFEDAAEFGFGMLKADEILTKTFKTEKKSHWIFGGDGWAYDIGYGGLEHVLSKGVDINVLVFDTEVYSNTGGQLSGATPTGAKVKFATSGKKSSKINLTERFISHGDVYVASVAMGADMNQCIKAMMEAESYPGPSIIFAYCPCIAHGIKSTMAHSQDEQALAVATGHWKLFRYDPRLAAKGMEPFQLDSSMPNKDYSVFTNNEKRFL